MIMNNNNNNDDNNNNANNSVFVHDIFIINTLFLFTNLSIL